MRATAGTMALIRRRLSPILLALLVAASGLSAASAQTSTVPRQSAEQSANRAVQLGVGKSLPVDLPRDARDVIVANPAIANAVVRSARRAFLIGVAVGQTNVFFLDAEGRQIASYDIEVGRDLGGLRQTLRSLLPGSPLDVRAVNDSVVVSGQVANALEAQQAIDVAARLVGDEKKVVNAITIRGRDQVLLKVTVSEVQRTIVKQLGVNLLGTGLGGGSNISTSGNFNATGTSPLNTLTIGSQMGAAALSATFKAYEEQGLVRTLAEPTLTAVSGEQARFLAGGEFPVPTGRDLTGNVVVEFKAFGVALAFTPVVLSEGRISLRVGVEVSEVDNTLTVQITGLTIRGLQTRRADTTVELPSGGSIVMAGLLKETTAQNINGVPGAVNLPILGALFRSRDYRRGQTELVISVTPYIARAVPANALARPDDNYQDASDPASYLLGRFNRIYGTGPAPATNGRFNGPVGFIRD
ncbi:MAG: type II and III secretion system protein family protein [Phreatobacter sp.]